MPPPSFLLRACVCVCACADGDHRLLRPSSDEETTATCSPRETRPATRSTQRRKNVPPFLRKMLMSNIETRCRPVENQLSASVLRLHVNHCPLHVNKAQDEIAVCNLERKKVMGALNPNNAWAMGSKLFCSSRILFC